MQSFAIINHFPGQSPASTRSTGRMRASLFRTTGLRITDDPIVLEALEQFIQRLGARYDGDERLGFLQAGLLGKW